MRRYADLALLIVLALAVRAACLADARGTVTFRSPLVDAFTYDQAAREVARAGPGALATPFYQPPLYPLLLGGIYALTGGSWMAPRVVQAILGGLTVALVAMFASRVAGRRAAWAAGGLLALYGPVLYFEGELLPPALLLALQTAGLFALWRTEESERPTRWLWTAGLCLGVAAAARPTGLLLAAGALAWRLRRGRRGAGLAAPGREALTFVAAVLLPVLPFTAANVGKSGELVLVSWNGGLNFYLGNGARSDSLTAIQPGHHWDRLQVEPFRGGVRGSRRAESDYWTRRALREAAADPVAWLGALGRKSLRLLGARETPRNTDYQDFRRDSRVLSLPLPGFGLVAPLALLGLLAAFAPSGTAPPRLRGLLAVQLAAVAAQNLLFFPADRYRLEAVPVLCLLAGLGADAALRRRGRLPVRVFAALAACVAITRVDFLGEWRIDEARGAIHRAVAMQRAGLEASSARLLQEALHHDARDVDANRLLGEHFVREGDVPRALVCFDRALEGAPDYVEALLAKARLLEARGAEAEALYRRALEADPYSARIRVLYGVFLAKARRFDDAREQFDAALRIDPASADARANLETLERVRTRS